MHAVQQTSSATGSRIRFLLGVVAIAVLAVGAGAQEEAGMVKAVRYSSYFVKNNAGVTKPREFRVAATRAEFDRLFGFGAVMRAKQPVLPDDHFEKNLVVAAIHQGKSMTEFTVQSVTAGEGVLRVRYQAKAGPEGSASFSCPLILSVPRGPWQRVSFVCSGQTPVEVAIPAGP